MENTLYSQHGQRKYLNAAERRKFIKKAKQRNLDIYLFCLVLVYTGCRISEALHLTWDNIDLDQKAIVFKSLKQRNKEVFRIVPVPDFLIVEVKKYRESQHVLSRLQIKLWPWARNTAWRYVKQVMNESGVTGLQASPKGLRHSFGVLAVQEGVPLNLIQKWLGHARMETTAIYTNALGKEERQIAQKLWNIS